MSSIKDLNGLFEHLLQDMYYAEQQIADTLPEMAEKATNPKLQSGFEQHVQETKGQIEKLQRVFEVTGIKDDTEKCKAIIGLLKEGDHLIKESEEGAALDAALIAAAQKVEHYEIASYGTLCHIAELLGQNEAKTILHEILEEERNTDEKLSAMATEIEEGAMKRVA